MRHYTVWVLSILVLLPGCGNRRKEAKNSTGVSSNECCSIDSIYKEQSRKEAAFSSIRKHVDICNAEQEEAHIVAKIEARCADIPVLVDAKPLDDYFVQDDHCEACLAYESHLSLDDVCVFYVRELERCGWRVTAQSSYKEGLIVSKKPGRYTIVSLRPLAKRGQRTMIVINQMRLFDVLL